MNGKGGARWVVEAVVIVGSILLAFAIQAAWDEWQESVAVKQLALGFAEDLEESLVDLRKVRELNAAKLEASLKARELLRSPEPVVPMDSLTALLRTSGGTTRLTPVVGAYEQFIATGLLRRLDPDIRAAIAGWSQRQEFAREYFERDLLDFRQNVALPYYVHSDVAFDEMLDGYGGVDFGAPRFPHEWASLHESHELNDVLAVFAVLTVSALYEYDRLELISQDLGELLRTRYGN